MRYAGPIGGNMFAMFNLSNVGPWQLIIVLVLVLIFFGAGKLPGVFREIGKATKAFKDGQKDDDADETMTQSVKLLNEGIEDAEEIKASEGYKPRIG